MSAKASMMVIDGFIDEMIELGERKEAQNCFRQLEFIIRHKCAGHPSILAYGIDPTYILEKYVLDDRIDGRYRERTMSGMITRAKTTLGKKPRQ